MIWSAINFGSSVGDSMNSGRNGTGSGATFGYRVSTEVSKDKSPGVEPIVWKPVKFVAWLAAHGNYCSLARKILIVSDQSFKKFHRVVYKITLFLAKTKMTCVIKVDSSVVRS